MVMVYLKSGILSDQLEKYMHPNCDYDLFLLLRDHTYSLQNIQILRYKRKPVIQFILRTVRQLSMPCDQTFSGPSAATADTYIYRCALKGKWNEQDIHRYFEHKVQVYVKIQQYSPSRPPYRFASLQHGLKSNQPRELQEENAQVKTLREL
jgi:hypothetical protein